MLIILTIKIFAVYIAVPFDFDRFLDEPADPGPFRKGAVTNMLWGEDAEKDDDAVEGGLGRSTGVTPNPVSCVTLQSVPCLSLRHISTATVRKMTQVTIDITITATIFPPRFEGWKAPAVPGAVEVPKIVTVKTHISVTELIPVSVV